MLKDVKILVTGGIHPDSASARWYNAIISPYLQRENNTPMVS